MKDSLISVIVPVYKVEKYLEKCIHSIVNQTYKNLEIILVDDGSPDFCPQICDIWSEKDKRIHVYHKENGGLSDARNYGLNFAKGEYISFVDSDDWIEPNMYEKMVIAIEKYQAQICCCGIKIYDELIQKDNFQLREFFVGTSEETLYRLYQDTSFPVSAWSKLTKKELWDNLRFPKGKICEDAFTTYLIIDKAENIVQIPDLLYHYRIRANSIMTSAFNKCKLDEEEAWRENYDYIRICHPNLAKFALDFYLKRINILLHSLSREERVTYEKEYSSLKEIFRKYFKYILFESQLTLKQRIKLLLNCLNF